MFHLNYQFSLSRKSSKRVGNHLLYGTVDRFRKRFQAKSNALLAGWEIKSAKTIEAVREREEGHSIKIVFRNCQLMMI